MTTAILGLEQPVQGVDNWHIPINANFGNIDSKLGQAYRNVWEEGGITYISNNAKYVTDHWERWNNAKGAWLIKLDEGVKTEYYCAAGSGTIVWLDSGIFMLNYIDVTAGTTIRKTSAVEYSTSSNDYVKLVEFTIPIGYSNVVNYDNIEFTITCDMKINSFDSDFPYNYVGYYKIYHNGVACGSEHYTSSLIYVTFTDNLIGWHSGDTIEVWVHRAASNTTLIKNFTVKSTEVITQMQFGCNENPVW